MFSLEIDFFHEFGLARLTEPEKPLNEMSRTVNNSLTKNELLLKKVYNLTPAPRGYKYCMWRLAFFYLR